MHNNHITWVKTTSATFTFLPDLSLKNWPILPDNFEKANLKTGNISFTMILGELVWKKKKVSHFPPFFFFFSEFSQGLKI